MEQVNDFLIGGEIAGPNAQLAMAPIRGAVYWVDMASDLMMTELQSFTILVGMMASVYGSLFTVLLIAYIAKTCDAKPCNQ